MYNSTGSRHQSTVVKCVFAFQMGNGRRNNTKRWQSTGRWHV